MPFYKAALTFLRWPSNAHSIPALAFTGSNLASVINLDGVTSLEGSSAHADGGLPPTLQELLRLPEGCRVDAAIPGYRYAIGSYVFYGTHDAPSTPPPPQPPMAPQPPIFPPSPPSPPLPPSTPQACDGSSSAPHCLVR
jgi:hypothetical protein